MKLTAKVLLVFAFGVQASAAQSPPNEKPSGNIAVFRLTQMQSVIVMSFSGHGVRNFLEPPDVIATPIVVFKAERFSAPAAMGVCTDKKGWTEFERTYVRGPAFSYYAGSLSGTLELDSSSNWTSGAAVEIFGRQRVPVPPSPQERALASNTDRLGRQRVTRRGANDDEKDEFLKRARNILINDLKVPESEITDLKAKKILATELGNGKPVLIGTTLATKGKTRYSLFLVLGRQDTSWRPILADSILTDPKSDFVGTINFVDQLDLDGDGLDEIFADITGKFGFKIYGFRDSRWRILYEDRRDEKGCIKQVR